ncbi:protein SET DOMAIN GROUP 41-like isoform X2 [Tasmannia lanceolata]|uniref:protein SET DOMAIN GROUP 41-like isoform X2 n=1 Tax=Tasmannia lanceolata TaxID=3420 RepID=UPI00406375EF
MEMRAPEEIEIGQDITPPILPLAFTLSDSSLHSHCSSCFHPLNPKIPKPKPNNSHNPVPIPCNSHCNSSLLYCSHHCRHADADLHVSSGECHLFLQSDTSTWPSELSQLRLALRLFLCFQKLGFLSPEFLVSGRIGGLMSNREKFDIPGRIREGGRIMCLARRMRDGRFGNVVGESATDEMVLCLVLTNAVEVQVSEGRTIGVAVYGPGFSWFNHSCSPNASYRFSLTGFIGEPGSLEPGFRVTPCGEEGTFKAWNGDEDKLTNGSCKYGPKVMIRSIKSIKKGEEVCVAYADLLHPKQNAANHSTCLDLDHSLCVEEAYRELTDCLDQAITEYMSSGNPESCCEMLEKMLIESSKTEQSQPLEPSPSNFKLHPLHHLSLNSYMTLASAYRIRALDSDSDKDNQLEAFELSRAGAAYSLLLAGATHHLFSSDSSLIAPAAHFWISAGESLMGLVKSSKWSSIIKKSSGFNLSSLLTQRSGKCLLLTELELGFVLRDGFDVVCKGFLACISRISPKVWPFLVHGLPYLKDINDPLDFSWLGMTARHEAQALIGGCECEGVAYIEEETIWKGLVLFALHCLLYGGYLTSVCYGPHCYLIGHVRNLLYGGEGSSLSENVENIC